MSALPALIWSLIVSVIPWALSKVMKAIGLGFVTYIGITVALDQAESFVFEKFNNIGGELFQILALAGVGQGMAILFSAFAAAMVLKLASGAQDTHRRAVWKKPGSGFEA